jgi:RimJ/RimL family protein N-acetyltransferase
MTDAGYAIIRGKQVVLRPVEEEDVELIHRWMNHPEIWHSMDYERPISVADVRDDIERGRKEGFAFTIAVDDRAIGRIGLNQLRRRDRICALYMYIGEPAFWGRGHGRDAVLTLMGYAFDRWDLHQIELWTLGDNDRALRTFKRAGFEVEARLRDRSWKNGRWVDRVIMSVTREEFEPIHRAWAGLSDPDPADADPL